MNLNLHKPICFFDLETTGLDVSQDRIVEISLLKVNPDGDKNSLTLRINPEMEISAESTEIHGISQEDIKDAPTFKEVAQQLIDFINNSDLGGYNSNRFDIPMLVEEFLRVGNELDMEGRKFVDVQTIFHKMEQRTLVAAYQFYCQKDLTDAHSSEADVIATYEVLKSQIERYDEVENDIDFLSEFSQNNKLKIADFAGRLAVNKENKIIYNFGKHKGRTVEEISKKEPGYYGWMMNNNFPRYTKSVLKKEMERIKTVRDKEQKNKMLKEEKRMENKLEALKNKFSK